MVLQMGCGVFEHAVVERNYITLLGCNLNLIVTWIFGFCVRSVVETVWTLLWISVCVHFTVFTIEMGIRLFRLRHISKAKM